MHVADPEQQLRVLHKGRPNVKLRRWGQRYLISDDTRPPLLRATARQAVAALYADFLTHGPKGDK